MKEFKYVVTDAQGIHARPAGILVKAIASSSSSPSAVMITSFPFFTPRLITAIMLFALTSRVSPAFLILISEVFFAIAEIQKVLEENL